MWQYHCHNLSRKRWSFSGLETSVTNEWLNLCDSESWESTFCVFTCLPEPWIVCSADRQKYTQPSASLWPHAIMDLIVCGILLPHPDVRSGVLMDGRKLFCSMRMNRVIFFHFLLYRLLFLHLHLWKPIQVHTQTPALMFCSFHTFVLKIWLLIRFCACSAGVLCKKRV